MECHEEGISPRDRPLRRDIPFDVPLESIYTLNLRDSRFAYWFYLKIKQKKYV